MANTLTPIPVFCRRNKNHGIYVGNFGSKVIRLIDRQTYCSKNPKEIKFLMDDPEIELLCSNLKEQKNENERNENKGNENKGNKNNGK